MKKARIGSTVSVDGVTGVVLRHGRDRANVYTEVRYDNGMVDRVHPERVQLVAPEPFSGPRYHDNAAVSPAGTDPCAICGKPIKATAETLWAHVVEGSARFLLLSEELTYVEDGGDQGCWPVGADCAKRFPAGYLATSAERERIAVRPASHDSMDPMTCGCTECDLYRQEQRRC